MGFGTFFLVILYAIACLILIFFILIQSGKGGGLSSLGAASQGISDAFGTTGAERALNKLTTIAAVSYIVLAILITLAISLQSNASKNILPGGGATTQQPISGTQAGAPAELPAGQVPGQIPPAAPAQ